MNHLSAVDRESIYNLSKESIFESSEDAQECRNYLKTRNISKQTALDFSLGYMPSRVNHFLSDRLILPIKYCDNSLAYLTTRKFRGDSINKGHWHESFDKSIFLFCHPDAYSVAYEKKYAVIVEGQFDCMALAQKGVLNTFSILGSNFSRKQILLLLGIFQNIILFFDNDDAGNNSAKKVLDTFYKEKMYKKNYSIKKWPKYNYKDPDDLVKNMSYQQFKQYYNSNINLILGDVNVRRDQQTSIFNF